jgi:hypothetical protein
MKKLILPLLGLSAVTISAQTLNQNTHAPAVGDIYVYYQADPASLPSNLGNAGSGNLFNFSGLNIISSPSYTSLGVTPVSTGSMAAYPSANVAVQTGTDNVFYNSLTNKLEYYGGSMTLGGYSVLLNYSTPAVLGIYPMSLGTTNTNTVSGTINAMGNSGNFKGTVSFTANATGTIQVPGATYTNVIRVEMHQNITFTIAFVQGTLTVEQYDYYTPSYSNFPNPNNNWPLLTVQASTIISTIGGTSTQTIVNVNKNYQTLNVSNTTLPVQNELTIFPNPVKDNFSIITNNSTLQKIQILDINGRIIKEVNPTNRNVDCSALSNGTYIIQAEDKSGKIITEKIVVQH